VADHEPRGHRPGGMWAEAVTQRLRDGQAGRHRDAGQHGGGQPVPAQSVPPTDDHPPRPFHRTAAARPAAPQRPASSPAPASTSSAQSGSSGAGASRAPSPARRVARAARPQRPRPPASRRPAPRSAAGRCPPQAPAWTRSATATQSVTAVTADHADQRRPPRSRSAAAPTCPRATRRSAPHRTASHRHQELGEPRQPRRTGRPAMGWWPVLAWCPPRRRWNSAASPRSTTTPGVPRVPLAHARLPRPSST